MHMPCLCSRSRSHSRSRSNCLSLQPHSACAARPSFHSWRHPRRRGRRRRSPRRTWHCPSARTTAVAATPPGQQQPSPPPSSCTLCELRRPRRPHGRDTHICSHQSTRRSASRSLLVSTLGRAARSSSSSSSGGGGGGGAEVMDTDASAPLKRKGVRVAGGIKKKATHNSKKVSALWTSEWAKGRKGKKKKLTLK
mmetsp:Transcript_30774/g.91438  ORF Transcript_30774/g.91438 Transcript_30774/m.91438 type:complete len:195 (-) Transcript_30774:851-1435(-)